MPFTFSHPAIILPLNFLPKKWFSLTGLIIGSLTPDFEYFLRMRIKSDYSHTLHGIFWLDLPLGILIAYLFHNMIKDHFIQNLPVILRSRFLVFKNFNWHDYFKKHWFVVIISILIGAASHIFWDSFTHKSGYFVQLIPLLTDTVGFFDKQIPIFKILQHLSTFIGGLVIAFAIYKLPVYKLNKESSSLKYWIIILGFTFAIIVLKFLNGLELNNYGNVIVTIISAGLLSIILTSIFFSKKKRYFYSEFEL